MIEYNDIKDLPIFQDLLANEYLTLGDFINNIETCIKGQKKFENIIYDILEKQHFDNEVLASLFTLSRTNQLEFNIKAIKDEL